MMMNCNTETPLTLATTELRQPLSMMIALVEGGAHLDYRNKASNTPMHKAAITGRREPIKVRTPVCAYLA